MPAKIRLQRRGKKGYPFYHLVIADSRTKRDGKYIEKIGSYNPLTNPATIDIEFDRTLYWLGVGAQPTETVKAILSYKGVLMKKHLNRGVDKGALTQEQADAKFEKWLEEKEAKVQTKKDNLSASKVKDEKQRLAKETVTKEKKAKEVLAKTSALADEIEVSTSDEQQEATDVVKDAVVEETVAEATEDINKEAKKDTADKETETPKEDLSKGTPKEEVKEDVKTRKAKEDKPQVEVKKEVSDSEKSEKKEETPKAEVKKDTSKTKKQKNTSPKVKKEAKPKSKPKDTHEQKEDKGKKE